MKKVFTTILILLFLLFSSNLLANPETYALEKGDKAPVSGVLLNDEAVATILSEREQEKERCLIETQKEVSVAEAKKDLELRDLQAILDSEKKQWQAEVVALNQHVSQLEELTNQSDLDWLWWGLGGVAVGSIVAGSTTAIVIALR